MTRERFTDEVPNGQRQGRTGCTAEDSGVMDKSLPTADKTAGDEGIGDVSRKNRAQHEAPVPDDQTSTPPGPAFKGKHDLP